MDISELFNLLELIQEGHSMHNFISNPPIFVFPIVIPIVLCPPGHISRPSQVGFSHNWLSYKQIAESGGVARVKSGSESCCLVADLN